MNLKYLLVTGSVPEVHPAALFLLAACLAVSFIFRKAFCSWLCPVGTVSEWLWHGGQELFGRNAAPPRWLDVPLRGLKYLLFGFFAWAIVQMSAGDIRAFMESPYGLVADVKMLNFFRHPGTTSAAVLVVLVALSVVVKNAWCRYLCPYGALVGLVSLVSPARIRRDEHACIDCAKCARACPSALPVDRLASVRSAECTGCLECVAVCPAAGALDLALPRRRPIRATTVAVGIALVVAGFVAWGRLSGHWETPEADRAYRELVPKAAGFAHPGM
jgi:polyferredoxin